MSSDLQLIANRENARHSTGSRTPEGKDRTRLNAFRHGLTGHRDRSWKLWKLDWLAQGVQEWQ